MNRQRLLWVGLAVIGIALAFVLSSPSPGSLPGNVCGEDLCHIRAGQMLGPCTTEGQVACFWDPSEAVVCANTASMGCVTPGADCGSCTGTTQKNCQNTNEVTCIIVYVSCCQNGDICKSLAAGCTCSSSGTTKWVGTHQTC